MLGALRSMLKLVAARATERACLEPENVQKTAFWIMSKALGHHFAYVWGPGGSDTCRPYGLLSTLFRRNLIQLPSHRAKRRSMLVPRVAARNKTRRPALQN